MNAVERREALAELLRQHGWVPFEGGPALATKTYETAVGPKEASAWLSRGAPGDLNQTLYGHYYSEGRNVMEPGALLIPEACDEADLPGLVAQFARMADSSVDGSYARRLWLANQREAAGLPRWP